MCHGSPVQRTVSDRELRNDVSKILREVEAGGPVTVTVDRRPVAELVPLHRPRRSTFSRAPAIAEQHAADRGLVADLRSTVRASTDDL
jgi:prevent-host-death family protein